MQISRFSRAIKFENEQRRLRYIEETKELARKHVELQAKWNTFAASTGMPANFNARLDQGVILSSQQAQEFGLARLDYEREVNSYFDRHEETLRAIGSGRLYQEERQLDAPLPLVARQDTPEAKGFQELLKYELHGPTDTQRVEAATQIVEQRNQAAIRDIKELAVQYKDLEQKWNAVTEEMGLDGIVSEEKEVFRQYVEAKAEVEAATAEYWKEHGWRHEQDAADGMAAEVFDSKVELNKNLYPDIRTGNGVVQSEEVRKLFRAEIEAAANAVEGEKYLPKTAEFQNTEKVPERQERTQDLVSAEAVDARQDEQDRAHAQAAARTSEFLGPRFTPMDEGAKNWARDNAFVNEHVAQHGGSNFHLVEERIQIANAEKQAERGETSQAQLQDFKPQGKASNDDKATRELYERVERQTQINIAEGKGKPDENSIRLGESIQASLRQHQAAQDELAERQRRYQAQQNDQQAMAA